MLSALAVLLEVGLRMLLHKSPAAHVSASHAHPLVLRGTTCFTLPIRWLSKDRFTFVNINT